MARSPRLELFAIQKKLWRSNKEIIESSILVKEPGFDRYERDYNLAVRDYKRVADEDEMLASILSSDIIYVGDYHTCNQSQRSFLRILKAHIKKDRHFAVGLELLHRRHQKILDDYLAGRLSEKAFLNRIKLKEHWVFDLWENFKPLFDFCKFHKIPMYAIDTAPEGSSVRRRDKATAGLIADVIEKNEAEKIGSRVKGQETHTTTCDSRITNHESRYFIFIGDLHLAPNHLPHDVDIMLHKKGLSKKGLILYEVSDPIYWKLARIGADDYVEVVKLRDGSFCRMHTPPVVCQRSYLNWLEHEEGEIDYADAKVSFLEIVDRICEFLKIKLGKARDEVEVFTCGDLSFLKKMEEKGVFSKAEIRTIKKQIFASESYYIAKTKTVYLANLSINHAAEEAAHFIKSICSGIESPRPVIDAFYANILHEAMGFFGSKLINHKRKCYHESDFKNVMAYFSSIKVPYNRKLEFETARLILEYKELERKGRHLERMDIFKSHMDLFLSLTHALGYMLGDRLYYGLISRKISKSEVRRLFTDPWKKYGRTVEVYTELAGELKGVRIPKRM